VRRGPLVSVAVTVSLLPGCALNGLAFKQDDRVEITSPGSNETLALPLTISWSVEDFDGNFAVFIDRSPMAPSNDLLSLVPRTDPCRTRSSCPDDEWLADHNVYVTDRTSVEVTSLRDRRATSRSEDRHELTIVLLDEDGTRLGESAFVREFIVDRED